MSRLVVRCFSVSVDGFGTGPEQSLADPPGKGGLVLCDRVFTTRTSQAMLIIFPKGHGMGRVSCTAPGQRKTVIDHASAADLMRRGSSGPRGGPDATSRLARRAGAVARSCFRNICLQD